MTQSRISSFPPGSIYGASSNPQRSSSPDTIRARRHRRSGRLRLHARSGRPPLVAQRSPLLGLVLRAYREGRVDDETPCPLAARLNVVEHEVEVLEAWAQTRAVDHQRSGATVRQALELLRHFSLMTTLDFSVLPDEVRPRLVQLLALEHRWCYAAAGTTRDAFKAETGRTGAR